MCSIFEDLQNSIEIVQLDALERAQKIKDERLIKPVIRLIDSHPIPQILGKCIRALDYQENPECIDILLDLADNKTITLGNSGNSIGQLAFWALAKLKDDRIVDKAIEVFNHMKEDMNYSIESDICEAAVSALEKYDSAKVAEFLISLLEIDKPISEKAAVFLRYHSGIKIVKILEATNERSYRYSFANDKAKESLAYLKRQSSGSGELNLVIENKNTDDYFSDGLVRFNYWDKKKEELWYGYLNKEGNVAIPAELDFGDGFSCGMARVRNEDDKYGFINKKGELVIPYKYDLYTDHFSEGFVMVAKENYERPFFFLNTQGKPLNDIQYDWAESFSEGLAAVKKGELWGYIDTSGNVVIDFQFREAGAFSEGLAVVEEADEWYSGNQGVINKKGEIVIPFKTARVIDGKFHNGLILVKNENFDQGFMDTSGELKIPYDPDKVYESFSEGLASFRLDEYGFIDTSGKIVIKPKFEKVESFSEGLTVVKLDGNYGYIDNTGKLVIKPILKNASSFKEGLAKVKMDDKEGFIKNPCCN